MTTTASLFLASILLGYLLGSISFGALVARAHGVNILEEGSGNPGATNVKRVLGKRAGNLVFFLDALKGFIAASWPLFALPHYPFATHIALAGLIACLLGHSFSLFLQFRGGKGVATTVGGLLALMPIALLIGVSLWLLVFFSTRYVSLASLVLGISLPISAFFLKTSPELFVFSAALAMFIVIRHRSNIQRLLAGTEHQFTRPSK